MIAPGRDAPEFSGDPWMHHMLHGDFTAAWEVCDAVLRARGGKPCWHLPRHEQYVWDGTPLHGKRVLVRCYHGLGDTVQFIRFAEAARAMAREVIVWAQPALLPILGTAPGIDRLLPLHDGAPEAAYDVDVESMELAHTLRVTPAMLPGGVPYLRAPGPESQPSHFDAHETLKVGLVWSCGQAGDARSIPLPELEPLMRLPHVKLHVLQRGAARAQWPAAVGIDVGTDNVAETARRMMTLDLVISVDSFPAHLAGALGARVWTLLPHLADWRWMINREDSPWYPTMRLFRQPVPGDWTAVIGAVCRALEDAVAGSRNAG